MTRTEVKQALIDALSSTAPYDVMFASDQQPRDAAVAKALVNFIATMDTMPAIDILTAALEQVVANASEDDGDFDRIETVELTDEDRQRGWVSPFDIMDSARARLRDLVDNRSFYRAELAA